jgi:DNA-binding PucR family transcriptional regulator
VSLEQIASELRENSEDLARRVAGQIRDTVPGYATVSHESLVVSVSLHIGTAAEALEVERVPSAVRDVSVAVRRAREGVAIEHVLLAIRVCFEHLREFVLDRAEANGMTTGSRLEAVRLLWDVNDVVSREYAVAHRHEDLEMARRAESQRAEFVRAILTDGLRSPEMVLYGEAFGLHAGTRRYRGFRARAGRDGSPQTELAAILAWATERRLDPVGAIVDGDAAGAFADTDETPDRVTVGIGPAVDLARLPESYRVATQVLEVGLQFGRTGVLTFEGLSLRTAVAAEHALGDAIVARRLGPLLERGEFGSILIESLDAYLDAGMSTTRAARELLVHRNTLRYRIDVIHRLTGIDLSRPDEIAEMWWALRRHEWMTRNQPDNTCTGS